MAQAKKEQNSEKTKKATSTATKKTTTPKVEEPKKVVISYVVPIHFQREPIEKDIHVADLYYHVTSNTFEFHSHAPQHEAHVEMIIEGDIGIEEKSGAIKMISKSETPQSWIISLTKSREFSGNPFIAGEAQEIYEN